MNFFNQTLTLVINGKLNNRISAKKLDGPILNTHYRRQQETQILAWDFQINWKCDARSLWNKKALFIYSLQHSRKLNEYRWFTWNLKWQTAISLQQDEWTHCIARLLHSSKRQSAFIEDIQRFHHLPIFSKVNLTLPWCFSSFHSRIQEFPSTFSDFRILTLIPWQISKVGEERNYYDICQRTYLWTVCCPILIKNLAKISHSCDGLKINK